MKKYFDGYRIVFTIEHGFVTFSLLYNPKPKSRTDYWRLDIHPFKGDDIKLLLCRKDIGAIVCLLGMAIKDVRPMK